jgi:hypothetical protein
LPLGVALVVWFIRSNRSLLTHRRAKRGMTRFSFKVHTKVLFQGSARTLLELQADPEMDVTLAVQIWHFRLLDLSP